MKLSSYVQKLNKKQKTLIVFGTIVFISLVVTVLTSLENKQPDSLAFPAKVGNSVITDEQLNSLVASRQVFFDLNQQIVDVVTLRKESLDILINEELIRQYAQERGVEVTAEDTTNLYNSRIQQFQTEDKLLQEIKRLYSLDKPAYLEQLKMDLLKERVQAQLNEPLEQWLENRKQQVAIQRSI
jgi:SurA N-terminal domain